MDEDRLQALIDKVTAELAAAGLIDEAGVTARNGQRPVPDEPKHLTRLNDLLERGSASLESLVIDLPDPTLPSAREIPGVRSPQNPDGLAALMQSTPARIGIGRTGTRYPTGAWLLFQSDHAVTQDALMREVDENLLDELGLFSVQTRITGGKEEYLLRPDLGRQLSAEAVSQIRERCTPNPNIQICVGDGLSAFAIEANLPRILPVLQNGFESAGLSLGTPFFIRYCRVGVMNDIGDLLHPDVLILLIGERPGLGRAESMSAYMAYRPRAGHTDAERDVICNIYAAGGTNPLEAGAYVVQMAQKLMHYQASGVQLRLAENGKEAA
jgi:ethanolamine ammonia-lyase small subunit